VAGTQPLVQFQRRQDGTPGVVFVGYGSTKQRQEPVPKVLRNRPLVTLYGALRQR